MSQFKYTITLKQHTPIIHFQANQSGATLRATELKPKFDKFLLKKNPNLKNNEGHLKYKVKIEKIGNPIKSVYKTYIPIRDKNNSYYQEGSYFGDNEAVLYNKIKIEFFSFDLEILKMIQKYFSEFISISSFGTRQNKGFGNFIEDNITQNEFETHLSKHYLICKKIENNKPLKEILTKYQTIKSGGRNGVKSKLMEYFLQDNLRWEKRWIKKKLKEKKIKWFNDLKDEYHSTNDFNFIDNEQFIFARALLGLSENNEFLVNSNSKDKIIVKISSIEDIKRFPSPIFIKVFDKTIYFLLNKKETINPIIFNKTFKFEAYYKSNKNNKVDLGRLTTPNNFDIEQFLKASL